MRGAVLYAPRDVRLEERDDPKIIEPGDAIIRMPVTCVCGSDLWDYRGINPVTQPTPMGHEYCGIVEEVGREVRSIKPGQFVIGSFFASDNTCPNCRWGFQSSCQHREFVGGAQAEMLRVPLADGTLVATPEPPAEELVPGLLTLSGVMATGWFAAVSANVQPGMTVAVVGDGAVGLLGVLSAVQMGAARPQRALIHGCRRLARHRDLLNRRRLIPVMMVCSAVACWAARWRRIALALWAVGRRAPGHAPLRKHRVRASVGACSPW